MENSDITRQDAKKILDSLGIKYRNNASLPELLKLIPNEDSIETKIDEINKVLEVTSKVANEKQSFDDWKRARIATSRARAMKMRRVMVVNHDPRENSTNQTNPVIVENQFFSASRFVPFNTETKIEQAICDALEAATILLHEDEYVNGKATGNKVYREVKHYTVQYLDKV